MNNTPQATPAPAAAPLTLHVIGAGRVGKTLARAFSDVGVARPSHVICRSIASAQAAAHFIGHGATAGIELPVQAADLWLICTPDDAITPLAEQLAKAAHGAAWAPSMAWHCSGFLSSSALAPLQRLGWAVASVHPALSFAAPEQALAQLPSSWFALEGDTAAVAVARESVTRLGAQCGQVTSDAKPLYHAAAVFTANFPQVLAASAERLWQDAGLAPADAERLRAQFLQMAVANIARLGPAKALTGPAARGDLGIVQGQWAALHELDGEIGAAYDTLTALAQRLARQGGL